MNWTKDDIKSMNSEENLYVAFPDEMGALHKPTWIWGVEVGGQLYARSYNGVDGRWYAAAKKAGTGHITIGSADCDVRLEFPTDAETAQLVSDAYAKKYASYAGSYLDPMLTQKSVDATVRFIPIAPAANS